MKTQWPFNDVKNEEPSDKNSVIAQSFFRCFHTYEGKSVLDYLCKITKDRFLGPDASDFELRFLEGQRALVAQIISLINKGKNGF